MKKIASSFARFQVASSFFKLILSSLVIGISLVGCKTEKQSHKTVNPEVCPETSTYPADADGEFDPMADLSAVPC